MIRKSRFWGAVLVDGQPRAEVRDLEGKAEGDTLHRRDVPEFRWFRVLSLEHVRAEDGEDCTNKVLCAPGAPCSLCVQHAIRYWYIFDARAAEHHFQAANLHARDRTDGGWRRADYCPCKKSHATEDGARRCAKKLGLELVRHTDGNGDNAYWIDVRPPMLGALFTGLQPNG